MRVDVETRLHEYLVKSDDLLEFVAITDTDVKLYKSPEDKAGDRPEFTIPFVLEHRDKGARPLHHGGAVHLVRDVLHGIRIALGKWWCHE